MSVGAVPGRIDKFLKIGPVFLFFMKDGEGWWVGTPSLSFSRWRGKNMVISRLHVLRWSIRSTWARFSTGKTTRRWGVEPRDRWEG